MKNKNIIKLLSLLSSVTFLASCGNPSSSTTTSQGGQSNTPTTTTGTTGQQPTTNNTSGGTTNTVPPSEETYKIVVSNVSGATLSVDKTQAKQGEKVTVTVTPAAGYTVTNIKVNDGDATKVNDTTYTFEMPDRDVRITVSLSVQGEITLSGGIVAKLEPTADNKNLYVAKNVSVETSSTFSYVVGGKTKLGIQSVDRTKTFADIDSNFSGEDTLSLAGGATYDFYYDKSKTGRPIYIQRVGVLDSGLPNSSSSLFNLFDGAVQSSDATNPTGVTSVSYENSITDTKYTWNLLTDKSSLAKATNLNGRQDKGIVYKELNADGTNLKVIDTYVEDGDASYNNTAMYSGDYKVSTTTLSGNETSELDFDSYGNSGINSQFINPYLSAFEAVSYSHNTKGIQSDIKDAYFVNMTQGSEITYVDLKIKSTRNDKGFTTTIKSSRTYDGTANPQLGDSDRYHDDYDVTLNFDKRGALLSGDYQNTHYDTSNWDFDTNASQGGVQTGTGKLNTISFTYTYGKVTTPSQEVQKEVESYKATYFASKVTPTLATMNVGDKVNSVLKLTAEPTTALDLWQYGVTASSNKTAVDYVTNQNEWVALADGTTSLTIGKRSGQGTTATVNAEVKYTWKIGSFYLADGEDEVTTASSALAYEGYVAKYTLGASAAPGTKPAGAGDPTLPPDTTLDYDKSSGLVLSLDKLTGVLTVDASKATFQSNGQEIPVTVNSSYYYKDKDSIVEQPTKLTLVVQKSDTTISDIQGTWRDANGDTLSLTKEDAPADLKKDTTPYKAVLTASGTTYTFAYGLNTKTLYLYLNFADGDYSQTMSGIIRFNNTSKSIEAIVYSTSASTDGGEATTKDIIGVHEDESVAAQFETFTKAN